jgi:hypothetical protein
VNELHVDSAAFTTPITLAHASASANALELAQRFAASYAQNSTRFLVRHDASDDVLSKTLRCGVTAIARVAIASDWLALIEWRERKVAPESEPLAARTFATTLRSYASLGSTNRHSIVTPAR